MSRRWRGGRGIWVDDDDDALWCCSMVYYCGTHVFADGAGEHVEEEGAMDLYWVKDNQHADAQGFCKFDK